MPGHEGGGRVETGLGNGKDEVPLLLGQFHHRIPLRLVQLQPVGYMAPGDHQAVPLTHRIGIVDAERQFVLQQHPAAALQRAEHTTRLPVLVAGEESEKVGAIRVPLAGIAAKAEGLEVGKVVGSSLVSGDDVIHLQGALVRDLLSNSPRRSIRSGPGRG